MVELLIINDVNVPNSLFGSKYTTVYFKAVNVKFIQISHLEVAR